MNEVKKDIRLKYEYLGYEFVLDDDTNLTPLYKVIKNGQYCYLNSEVSDFVWNELGKYNQNAISYDSLRLSLENVICSYIHF